MKSGPKALPTAGPLDLSDLPQRGGDRVIAFIERFCLVPRGVGARKPMVLRPWQRDIVHQAFDDPRPHTVVVSMPRSQGKTTLAAPIAIYGLLGEGIEGPSVGFIASDERQAQIGFNVARRMIELNPELSERCLIYRDHIRVPETDGILRALPAEASSLQGQMFSMAIVDELHVVRRDTRDAVSLASGKYPQSLTLSLSTPSDSQDSVMWALREQARAEDDPMFRWIEYAAPMGCAIDDEEAWAIACPALDDFFSRDQMRSNLKTSRESAFRRFRLGQWVGHEGSWMPSELWRACELDVEVPEGTPVVLGFDGSIGGVGSGHDSTALVGCTVDADSPHLFVVGIWESDGSEGWNVPRDEVEAAITAAFGRYDCRELVADPWGWRREIEAWSQRWPGRVLEFPTNRVQRMAPATDRLYQAVKQHAVTHDGHERLAAHVTNAVVKTVPGGEVITKVDKHSANKIDGAIAACLALDRASWHAHNAPASIEGIWFG